MKKNLFTVAMFAFALSAMISCSKEESANMAVEKPKVEIKSEADAFKELDVQLDAFTSDFMKNITTINTRAEKPQKGSFWKKVWQVAKADFVGAIVGVSSGGKITRAKDDNNTKDKIWDAVVAGIVASINEIGKMGDSDKRESLAAVRSSEYGAVIGNSGISVDDSVGYYHNLIIHDLCMEYPTLFWKSEAAIINLVGYKARSYGFPVTSAFLGKMPTLMADLRMIVVESNDITFQKLSLAYPEFKNEIAVTRKYYANVSKLTNMQDIIAYTAEYRELVLTSSISSSSMSFVRSSISVAANSSQLWSASDN